MRELKFSEIAAERVASLTDNTTPAAFDSSASRRSRRCAGTVANMKSPIVTSATLHARNAIRSVILGSALSALAFVMNVFQGAPENAYPTRSEPRATGPKKIAGSQLEIVSTTAPRRIVGYWPEYSRSFRVPIDTTGCDGVEFTSIKRTPSFPKFVVYSPIRLAGENSCYSCDYVG